IGFLSQLFFSHEIFKTNNELYVFLKQVFKVEFKQYIISSRTLMFSRLAKHIVTNHSKGDLITIKNNIINTIYGKLDEQPSLFELTNDGNDKDTNKSKKKKNTTTESIAKWIKGFQGE
ncbi:hypothetical protein, partial [Buttiauxella noackiae]|uniref:hypothetical protein n=1 Tax=Buttiauxella noackiae TaxID=82992 RepID=UPI0007E41C1E